MNVCELKDDCGDVEHTATLDCDTPTSSYESQSVRTGNAELEEVDAANLDSEASDNGTNVINEKMTFSICEYIDKLPMSETVINKKRACPFDELEDEPPVSQLKLRKFPSFRSVTPLRTIREEESEETNGDNENMFIKKSTCDVDNENALVVLNIGQLDSKSQNNITRREPTAQPKEIKSQGPMPTSDTDRYRDMHCDSDQKDTSSTEQGTELDENIKQGSGQLLVLDSCHQVFYVHSQQLLEHCNQLPRIRERAGMVHSLIEALGLLQFLTIVPPMQVAEDEVMKFHSRDYIEFLQRINNQEDEEKIDPEEAEQYGLTYDCPVQDGVYDCAEMVAGATITAAEALCEGKCQVAVNWYGGWHHAQRSEASGFCYINDIVLGILRLRSKFSRVLYVDLDLHHGDGVENAFSTTSHVMTVSFHKYDAGFFPGSGSMADIGSRGGKYYCVNVPLKDGICDTHFVSAFKRVMSSVRECYAPEVVVCQCGADGLAGDPMSSFNLTLTAYRHCLYFLMVWKLPLLLLGGGGYHHANTARCWASLAALTVGRKLPQDVPDHQHFPEYGPDYELTMHAGNRKNHNDIRELVDTCRIVTENLQKIKGAHT